MEGSRLAGKGVLITGAASGMGASCAETAVAEGASVYAVDRDGAKLAQLASRLDIAHEACDLTAVEALPALIERCEQELGHLDGVVNAAGVFQTREVLEITPAEFDALFAVNVRALFFVQQAAARAMIRDRGGSIVNFASTAARVPRPVSSHYAATKVAVVSISRSAAAAWGRQGVRVNSVCPGVIETPMIAAILEHRAELAGTSPEEIEASWREMNPMGRLGTPFEVANVVTFLLSDEASYVTGESVGINGGSDDV